MEEEEFSQFFSDVLQRHSSEFCVNDAAIKSAIHQIHFAYSEEGQRQSSVMEPVDYNEPAYRCAYLHKYAGFHAAMVDHVLTNYLKYTPILGAIPLEDGVTNICCLGGGPGNDIVGLANTLSGELNVKKIRLTTVDIKVGWAKTFDAVSKVAKSGKYKFLRNFFSRIVCSTYIDDDLLHPGSATKEALQSAHLVTMIKFVSAVKQNRATKMLKTLFGQMRPGAVLLFIDNDGGSFFEKVSDAAVLNGLEDKCDPFRHVLFECKGQYRFKSRSISSTTVSAQIWKKSYESSIRQAESSSESEASESETNEKGGNEDNEIWPSDWEARSDWGFPPSDWGAASECRPRSDWGAASDCMPRSDWGAASDCN